MKNEFERNTWGRKGVAERIDIGRLIKLRPVIPNVRPAKIVGHNLHDIWTRGLFRKERSGRSDAK